MPVRSRVRRASTARAVTAATALLLGLTALSACATADPADSQAVPPAVGLPDVPTGVSCQGDPFAPASTEGPEGPRLAVGFKPVVATQCLASLEQVPGDGEWTVRVHQRTTTGLDALARALRLSSAAPDGSTCDNVGYPRIVLTLSDAGGHDVTPAIPRGVCGAPLPQVVAVLEALRWTTTGTERVSQSRSQLEIDTGCPGSYKPTVALTAAESGGRIPVGPAFTPTPTKLRVCRYQLSPTGGFTVAGTTEEFHDGRLATAAMLKGAALTTVLGALDGAPPAAACARAEAPFAVLQPAGGGAEVAVELGGCLRALDPAGALRQLDAATVALIAG